jgi:hypothetical protein
MTAEATGQKPGAGQEQADSGEPAWRGIATEEVDEVSAPLAALLRRRSRALLSDLMRPHRRQVAVTRRPETAHCPSKHFPGPAARRSNSRSSLHTA